ncbi:MAG: ABC transporter ATP-binding protein [Candidatus Polarisedimenticolia bacterium]|nr:ABC transporter ATP-binding protein [bacterium]
MILIEGLTKRYEDVLALDHLDLTVRAGEICCLLGANGAGKSTTINILLNFIQPTEGRATINRADVTQEPLAARSNVAYLPENVFLYGSMSVRQNLSFFSEIAGRGEVRRSEAETTLEQVGLGRDVCARKVKTLSKGMRQKVGVAACLLKQAPVLIMDEPMSGLDPKAMVELTALLLGQRERGKAILISTHDVFRARQMADRIVILRDGRKVADRTRSELAGEDLEALYLQCMSDEQSRPSRPGREEGLQ